MKLTIPKKKEHKEEAETDVEAAAEKEQESPVNLVTHKNNILHSIFRMLECTSIFSKSTTLLDCMRTNLRFPTTSKGPSLNTRVFCTARATTMKKFLIRLWERLCLNLFSQGE